MFGTSTDEKLQSAFSVFDPEENGRIEWLGAEAGLLIDSVLGLAGHTEAEEDSFCEMLAGHFVGVGASGVEASAMTREQFVEASKTIPQILRYFISTAMLVARYAKFGSQAGKGWRAYVMCRMSVRVVCRMQTGENAARSVAFASDLERRAHALESGGSCSVSLTGSIGGSISGSTIDENH